MRIAINGLSARTGGGVVYLRNLLRSLLELDCENQYVLFTSRVERKKIAPHDRPRLHVIEVRVPNLLYRLLYEQIVLPIVLWRRSIDVIYAPAEIVPFFAPCKVVLGIQNAEVYQGANIGHSLAERMRNTALRTLARLSSRRANGILFMSETSRTDVSRILMIDPGKSRSVYHGVDLGKFGEGRNLDVAPGHAADDPSGPILCVSAISPHKNLECLIEAYAGLDKGIWDRHPMTIVGPIINQGYHSQLVRLLQRLGVERRVAFLGEIPLESMPRVYQDAALFVFPSLLETFGIPLVEAMAAAIPVIASNVSCIPEVLGDAGLLFDPKRPDELSEKIALVLHRHDLRRKMVRRGLVRARQFSWETTAAKTLEVLKRVCGTSRDPRSPETGKRP